MFWNGRRVFLTGHTGFKGSWLSLWLQALGARVTGYSLPPVEGPNLFEAAKIAGGMRSQFGDICDLKALQGAVSDYEPEIVIHMAAQPLVRLSYEQPLETYQTNVIGTANLLDAVRRCHSVRAVVVITTDKCYDNQEWIWPYRENDRLGGYDPYSNSKACAELVVAAYRNSFFNESRYSEHGVAIASARAGNVIGGGDWAKDRLVPDIIGAFSRKETVLIRNPVAIRPWQHVLEPLRGYLTLAEHLYKEGPTFSGGWNFGPQYADSRPVQWIVERMASSWGPSARWLFDSAQHPHEAQMLKLDWSKAAQHLKWQPALRLSEALDLTVDWYKKWSLGEDMHAFTLRQLQHYGKLTASETELLECVA